MLLDPSSPEGIEARRFVERVRASRPYATTAVLASLIAVFVAESAFGGNEDVVTLAHMGANVVARTRGGELERVLAASTLHHGLMHIAMNGYVLWSLGRVVEALFGSARFLVLYVCAAILGGLATTLLGGGTVSVGASGAVWGVLTGMGVLAFRPALSFEHRVHWLTIHVAGSVIVPFQLGAVSGPRWFPGASAMGWSGQAGVGVRLDPTIELRGSASYESLYFTLDPVVASGTRSAQDQVIGGWLGAHITI